MQYFDVIFRERLRNQLSTGQLNFGSIGVRSLIARLITGLIPLKPNYSDKLFFFFFVPENEFLIAIVRN